MSRSAARFGYRPAVFLDRDGTVIAEKDYLSDPAEVELLPGVPAALRAFREAGYALVIATNQSGIARGLFGEEEFEAVQRRLEALLDDEGVHLDGVYHCPHHPEFTGSCDCRKPAAGLFVHAAFDLDLDLSRSVWIGDRARDVTPALDFGGRGILVRTGYGEGEAGRVLPGISVADDLVAAASMVFDAQANSGNR